MLFVDYAGETIALMLAKPNFAQHPAVELTLPTDVTRGLSAREARTNFARSMRYSLGQLSYFGAARPSTDFRLWLNRLKGETVAAPLWLDGVQLSIGVDAPATTLNKTATMPVRYGAEWIILSNDLSVYEIITVSNITSSTVTCSPTTLNWPTKTFLFPLVFGRLPERPQIGALKPGVNEAELKLKEDSPYARRLNPLAVNLPTVGLAHMTDFGDYLLWTKQPVWSRPLDRTEVDILYADIGFLRQSQKYVYQQPIRRGEEMEFFCWNRDEIAWVEAFFSNRRGSTRPFFLPTFRNDLELQTNLPNVDDLRLINAKATRYTDPDYANHPGEPYLAFIDNLDIRNVLVDPQKVTLIDIDGLHTEHSITQTHKAATTRLSHLLLVRFAESTLTWEYLSPTKARCKIKFIELPDEYVTPNTEVERAFLYKIQEFNPDVSYSYYTSYENAISWDGQTWTPAPFSHDDGIDKPLRLDQVKVALKSWGGNFPGNPLAKFLPNNINASMWLGIVMVNAAAPSDASSRILFMGAIASLDMTGVDWQASCIPMGGLFAGKFPSCIVQKSDNWTIFSPPTRLNKETFKVTGTVTLVNTNKTLIHINAGTDKPSHYFAHGWMEIGSGATYETRGITDSYNVAGPFLRLILDRPLIKNIVTGGSVKMYPGYDGSLGEAISKFNNGINHGGFPFVPDTNPLLKAAKAADTGAAKK